MRWQARSTPTGNGAGDAATRRVRRQLGAGSLVLGLLVAAICAHTLWRGWQAAMAEADAKANNLCVLLDRNVSSVLERASIVLGATAGLLERQFDAQGIERHGVWHLADEGTALVPEIAQIGVFDARGQQVCGDPAARCPHMNVADHDYFQQLQAQPESRPRLFGPYRSQADGRPSLVLARALQHPDKRFAGVVIAVLPLQPFESLLGAVNLGRDGAVALRGADLGVLVRVPAAPVAAAAGAGAVTAAELNQAVSASPAEGGLRRTSALDGIERQEHYRRLREFPVYVVVGLSTHTFLAPWRVQAWGTLGFLALFAASSIIISRLLLAAVQERKRFVEQLEQRVEQRTLQLRQLAAALDAAESRERQQLARDLHDDLGQTLAAARIHLAALGRGLDGEARALAQRIDALIERANLSTRSLAAQLAPPVLYELGLTEALEWLGDDIGKNFGLQVSVVDDGLSKPLSAEARTVLYRATRELLINSAKHAHADAAEVEIERQDGQIVVRVADSGVGFDASQLTGAKGRGTGLLSVRERLAFIGGSVDIRSVPGDGAVITLTAPLSAAPPSATPLAGSASQETTS